MKVIENTTAYKCEFCGKTSLRRHNMESHERSCRKNPKNRAMCYNCVHQIFDGEQEENDACECPYVILDDDTDMLLWQKDNFVKTDCEKGLSRRNVKRAIAILNREDI